MSIAVLLSRALGCLCLALELCGCASTLSLDELRARASEPRCEQAGPGRLIYSGDSAELPACLEAFGLQRISELRITSRGGDAWPTLQLANRYAGEIDLLVVDGLCASSCANYLIPAARRLRVLEDSLVLLHGSINVQQVEKFLDQNREALQQYLGASMSGPLEPEFKRFIAATKHHVLVQSAFEAQQLACADWLNPDLHSSPEQLPSEAKYLIVTEEMAVRCLNRTQIEAFWPPPVHGAIVREFREEGLFRAGH